eukprot:jgi/Hompol1/3817/HPOL_003363-RA
MQYLCRRHFVERTLAYVNRLAFGAPSLTQWQLAERGAGRIIGFQAPAESPDPADPANTADGRSTNPKTASWPRGVPADELIARLKHWEQSDARVHVSGHAASVLSLSDPSQDPDINAEIVQQPLVFDSTSSYEKEVSLGHFLATLDIPLVSIMNDPVGLGISVHAPFRIATEKTQIALPDSILEGLHHVGISFFLSRISSGIKFARYLLLTGKQLNGMEAFLAGFATHYIHEDRLPALIDRLCYLESSDLRHIAAIVEEFISLVNSFSYSDGPTPHLFHAWIPDNEFQKHFDRCFGYETFDEIVTELKKDAGLSSPTAATLMHDKTFSQHLHRTVTELPTVDDVRKIVTGEHPPSGNFALTKEEVINWFDNNWSTMMHHDLTPVNNIKPESGGNKYLVEGERDPFELESRKRARQRWALEERVGHIIDRHCVPDKAGYLKWRS